MQIQTWIKQIKVLSKVPQSLIIQLNPDLDAQVLINQFFKRLIDLNLKLSDQEKTNLLNQFDQGQYPDYLLIHNPDHGYYTKKDLTPLFELLQYTIFTNHSPRLIVIDHVENLDHQTNNSLLKLIEEPPKNTYFMLLTNNHERILPTIISRCHFFSFMIKPKSIKKVVKNFKHALFFNGYGHGEIQQMLNNPKMNDLFDSVCEFYQQQSNKKFAIWNWTFQNTFVKYNHQEISYFIDFLIYLLSDFDDLNKLKIAEQLINLKLDSWQIKPNLLYIYLISLFHHG